MMKKDFDWGILLLPLEYLLFALALYIGLKSVEIKEYPTTADVRASFDQHFGALDQASRVLWEHPDYFDYLYEKTETRTLLFNPKNTLDAYGSGGRLSAEEWNRLRALCEIIQPHEINMYSHDGANAIQWAFLVQDSGADPYTLSYYYIRVPNASAPEKEQAVSENALSYFGRYGSLSPVEGKKYWYEAAIVPVENWYESLTIINYQE